MTSRIIEDYAQRNIAETSEVSPLSTFIENKIKSSTELLWDSLPLDGDLAIIMHSMIANYKESYPLHSHDFFEIVYIYRGTAMQYTMDQSIRLEEGSVCLMNTNCRHGLSIDSMNSIVFNILIAKPLLNTSFLNLISNNELFSNFFINSLFSGTETGEFMYFERNSESNMEILMQSLIEEYILQKPDYQSAMQSYLSLIFTELHRKHIYTSGSAKHLDIPFPQIMSYVSSHLGEVSINSLAERFHYTPSYLSKSLKRYLGRSFSSVLAELRLQKAASYLETTTIAIDSIVELLGYYDRSYFNKVFRKQFGCGPKEYRDLHSGEQ